MFFTRKVDFFNHLDKILDDDNFRLYESHKAIDRAKQLANNEHKSLEDLHKKLSE
jgi:hypothetical protein